MRTPTRKKTSANIQAECGTVVGAFALCLLLVFRSLFGWL